MTLKASFATVLRAIRAKRNISQRDLTDATSRTYLSKLETGKSSITLDKLQQLSDHLCLSPLTLLTMTISENTGQATGELINKLRAEILEFDQNPGAQPLPSLANILHRSSQPHALSRKRRPVSLPCPPRVPPAQAELAFID